VSPVARQIAELKEIAEELYCKAEAEGVYGAGEPWSVEFAANNRWAARAALDRLGDELSTIIRGLRNEVVTYGLTSPRPLVWSRAPEPGASDSAPTPFGSRTASPDPCYTEPPDDADANADAAAAAPTTPAAATAAGDDPEEEPQPAAAAPGDFGMFGTGLSACEYFVRQHVRSVRGQEWPAPQIRAFFRKGTTQKEIKITITAAAEIHAGKRQPEGTRDRAWAAGLVQAMLGLGMFPNPGTCFPSRREFYDNLEKELARIETKRKHEDGPAPKRHCPE
jgi:hypothetical protein